MAAFDSIPVVAGLVVGIAFVVSFSMVLGVKPPPSPESVQSAVITMERSVCFGACPDYSLTIYGNGTVIYEGRRFVEVAGRQTATVPAQDVRGLVEDFYKIGYFSLRDEYTAPISDLPTTTTSITIDGRTKQVVDYYGAPEALKQLEDRIDDVANSKVWVAESGHD